MSQRLKDGHPTTINFSLNPNVKLWEMTVTPPGISAGGANDTTSMRNTTWRTNQPKHLKTLTPFTFDAQYDPIWYDQALAMAGVNQLIYVLFPDGDKYYFWGWLDTVAPNAVSEGSPPTVSVTVIPSNQDNTGAEVAPYRTAA